MKPIRYEAVQTLGRSGSKTMKPIRHYERLIQNHRRFLAAVIFHIVQENEEVDP